MHLRNKTLHLEQHRRREQQRAVDANSPETDAAVLNRRGARACQQLLPHAFQPPHDDERQAAALHAHATTGPPKSHRTLQLEPHGSPPRHKHPYPGNAQETDRPTDRQIDPGTSQAYKTRHNTTGTHDKVDDKTVNSITRQGSGSVLPIAPRPQAAQPTCLIPPPPRPFSPSSFSKALYPRAASVLQFRWPNPLGNKANI